MFPRLILLGALLFVVSCGGQQQQSQTQSPVPQSEEKAAQPAPETPTLDTKGALLREGFAACVVVFPKSVNPGEWLAQIRLVGDTDTDRLPRIPLASSSTITLLNIPPGTYTIHAKAWQRKSSPYAGGQAARVSLIAGELTILRAESLSAADVNPDDKPLSEAGRKTWTVSQPQQLPMYIMQTADAARG